MKQMKRRILNIASYEKPTLQKKLKSFIAFLMISILLFGLTPFVSTYATDEKQYQWNTTSKNCSEIDLRNYFGKYEGTKLIAAKPLFQNQVVFLNNISASSSSFHIFYHTDNQYRTFRIFCCKNCKPS